MGGLLGAVQWWDESQLRVLDLARSMGDLSGAVEWWDESQLRVLVLGSLGIQYLLAFFAGRRKYSISSWFRFVIWLLYLGSDALAIYALAALFNRQKKPSSSSQGSRDLEVLWAPIMLTHVGGTLSITAYNIEENELWRRPVVTAISQVAVALFVFYKSWPSSADGKLLAAAIMIFIPGILKCFTKPWAFKYASFNSLANSFDIAERTTVANREQELQRFVQEARNCVGTSDYTLSYTEISDSVKLYVPEMLFVDFSYPYSRRLTILKSFLVLGDGDAYSSLRDRLSDIFDLLYTGKKLKQSMEGKKERNLPVQPLDFTEFCQSCVVPFTLLFSLFLPLFSIILFSFSNKKAYRSDDVTITFLLLISTMFLAFVDVPGQFASHWPDTVAQRSILGQFAQNIRHAKLMSWATCLGCKDLLGQCWSMESCHSSQNLAMLVRTQVQDGWKDYIKDVESYREFNDIRGQWTLERQECHEQLNWSLEKPFDESILLWHIATDLCFHSIGRASPGYEQPCRQMSNYMMYLLVANPEMLMPGSRRSLFAIASNQLEAIREGEEYRPVEEGRITKQLFQKVMSAQDTSTKETFIYDACVLARGLMDLGDAKMWKVIQGVWLEMMCFSAGRCRGYLHAKALGSGGEYLSYVWLVLAHYGMETFSERFERTTKFHFSRKKAKHIKTRGGDIAGTSASQGTEEEITAAPSTSQGYSAVEIVVPA